jgi:uncharacterized membrane protein
MEEQAAMYARTPIPKRAPPPDGLAGMPRWPASIALLAMGAIYYLVSAQLRIGPPWLLLALEAVATVALAILRRVGMHLATRKLALGLTGLVTVAVSTSALFLVTRLTGGKEPASRLLRDAGLVWLFNILVFATWYWEIDAGGPTKRQRGHHASADFVFPQMAFDDEESARWSPEFLDYLFLAFNTSTAFSPTDTLVLSRRVKVLMMYQSLVSLVIIAVLIARGINTLQ